MDDALLDSVEEKCLREARRYRAIYGEELPVNYSDFTATLISAEEADLEDVHGAVDDISDFYDDLLGVNSTEFRGEFKDNCMYDPAISERFEIGTNKDTLFNGALAYGLSVNEFLGPEPLNLMLGAGLFTLFSLVTEDQINGRYSASSNRIGISDSRTDKAEAYSVAAAELYHAFQDYFDSDVRSGFPLAGLCTNPPLLHNFCTKISVFAQ